MRDSGIDTGSVATPSPAEDKIRQLAVSFETGGSVFILGLMVLQTITPLPAGELAGRIMLACWTLTSFRLIPVEGNRSLGLQALIQLFAVALLVFLKEASGASPQLAIDVVLIYAGWIALVARWCVLYSRARVRSLQASMELEQKRDRILFGTAR